MMNIEKITNFLEQKDYIVKEYSHILLGKTVKVTDGTNKWSVSLSAIYAEFVGYDVVFPKTIRYMKYDELPEVLKSPQHVLGIIEKAKRFEIETSLGEITMNDRKLGAFDTFHTVSIDNFERQLKRGEQSIYNNTFSSELRIDNNDSNDDDEVNEEIKFSELEHYFKIEKDSSNIKIEHHVLLEDKVKEDFENEFADAIIKENQKNSIVGFHWIDTKFKDGKAIKLLFTTEKDFGSFVYDKEEKTVSVNCFSKEDMTFINLDSNRETTSDELPF